MDESITVEGATPKVTPLSKAVEHTTSFWFPSRPEALEKLRRAVWSSDSQSVSPGAISEASHDLSLFLWAIRELNGLIDRGAGPKIDIIRDPIETLASLSKDDWREILPKHVQAISSHAFEASNESQRDRLQGALFSASCAELIADSFQVEPTVAFSCAFLRQLGLALIAYNYPRVYQAALTSRPKTELFERALSRTLGFSPTMLGAAVAQSWRLSVDLTGAISPRGEPKPGIELLTLSKLCRVGELLAMAEKKNHYPEARGDWEEARRYVEGVLGSYALELISCRLSEYQKGVPGKVQLGQPESATVQVDAARGGVEVDTNHYINLCPQAVGDALRDVYLSHSKRSLTRRPVDALCEVVLTKAKFVRGCVYLAELESGVLTPRLRMGDSYSTELPPDETNPGEKVSDLTEINYIDGLSDENPIVVAFKKCAVQGTHGTSVDGRTVSYFTGPIGTTACLGVLYLEFEGNHFDPEVENVFRAVLQTFNHVLDL